MLQKCCEPEPVAGTGSKFDRLHNTDPRLYVSLQKSAALALAIERLVSDSSGTHSWNLVCSYRYRYLINVIYIHFVVFFTKDKVEYRIENHCPLG